MPDYSEWTVTGSDGGEVSYIHSVCYSDVEALYGSNLADDLARIAAHDCPGPPPVQPIARCEHGAPISACRQHPAWFIFPVVH